MGLYTTIYIKRRNDYIFAKPGEQNREFISL
jgi:hypothetical protein